MGTIEQQLEAYTRIGLDTRLFIYHLESHLRYQGLTNVILAVLHQQLATRPHPCYHSPP